MSYFMLREDFDAIGLSKGVREVCLNDAWARFDSYSGPAGKFFDETKAETLDAAPHWWAAPALDTPDERALYSLGAQAAYVKAHGEAAAKSMLAAEGLKLGQVKKAPVVDPSGSNNPYLPAAAGQEAARLERILKLIKSSTKLASSLAKSAGCRVDGTLIPQK